jgi:excisionase family DNA binding protein
VPSRKALATAEPPVLTVPAAAGRLGCSETHVYRLIAAGVLRAVDIAIPGAGRSKTRVRADDLADYINRQTRTA